MESDEENSAMKMKYPRCPFAWEVSFIFISLNLTTRPQLAISIYLTTEDARVWGDLFFFFWIQYRRISRFIIVNEHSGRDCGIPRQRRAQNDGYFVTPPLGSIESGMIILAASQAAAVCQVL